MRSQLPATVRTQPVTMCATGAHRRALGRQLRHLADRVQSQAKGDAPRCDILLSSALTRPKLSDSSELIRDTALPRCGTGTGSG